MKKIKLTKGLQLSKESLSRLQDSQMSSIKGQGTNGPRCTCRRHSCFGNGGNGGFQTP
ncbi:class I lanthipeptide [Aquimarina sp. RZ0]|uniref:class I lanthipeptide n=1 Tax=Aquimarina sp. RZ0 TaxID=2607730 RepID=UPI00165F3F99|nr:class I lanthipeptide [Aquimarina sp. RZ0]